MTGTANAGHAPADTSGDAFSVPREQRSGIRLLVIDDERTLRESCASVLQMEGYTVETIGRGEEALEVVRRRRFDIILCDLYMSQVSGIDILRAALEANRGTIVITMTGNPSVSSSIEAVRAGAWDYLPKPFSATHLQVLIGRASHAVLAAREQQGEKVTLMRQHGHSAEMPLIGVSERFREAVTLARKVAATDASVMISGETGTGKEVIAQFIHQLSRRANRVLVPINCAALPEPLLESELFGHRKGAFTGADRDKRGLLEVADGGTLFLDELTEMSLPLQAKLLRVLQDGVVRRVGSEVPDATVNVRFISATNRDPQQAVRDGVLRSDVYYRLRVVPIVLPPLRERPEDIEPLANHFLLHYWQRHRQPGEPAPRLSPGALALLQSLPWRGNVRELQNMIEQLAVLAEPGQEIQPADVAVGPGDEGSAAPRPVLQVFGDEPFHVAKDRVIADFEKRYLQRLVERANGNMSKAARLAGVDRTTLYRLMDKHELRGEEPLHDVE